MTAAGAPVSLRRAFAERILAAAGIADARLADAFGEVPREAFLGPGPWPVYDVEQGRYVTTPDADPARIYTDDLVGILPSRHINNGQPSFHAGLLARASVREGEHAVHIGAGAGYYSAILAHLVGASGRVTAIELDRELATRAEANLAPYGNARVLHGDGARVSFDTANIIYVNAGVTHPADSWLDRLADGGRLVLPLTASGLLRPDDPPDMQQRGVVFLVERDGAAFNARWISSVAIFPCASSRDDASERALADAIRAGDATRVTRLYRDEAPAVERCWFRGPGWSLA